MGFLPPISLNWWPTPDFLFTKKNGIKIDMYAAYDDCQMTLNLKSLLMEGIH